MDKNEIIFKREKIIRNMRLENSNISYHELLNLLEELETKNNKI
ncbi:hypothetical protein [Clostridium perfringens]|nr:hypothetical protein [Clostridium perfringens]